MKIIQILIPTPIKNFYDEEGNIKRVYFATKGKKRKLKKGILKDAPPTMSYKKVMFLMLAKLMQLPKICLNYSQINGLMAK